MRTREEIGNRISLLVVSVGSRIVPLGISQLDPGIRSGVDEICTLMFIDSVFAPIGLLRSATYDSSDGKCSGKGDSRCSGLTSPPAGAVGGASLFSSDMMKGGLCAEGF